MRRVWNEIRLFARTTFAQFVRTPCRVENVLRRRIGCRRLVIVAATFLVCAYAAGVLGYVWLFSPDIGVRCAFTPVVNHFNDEFLFENHGEPPEGDDTITRIGNQEVSNWAQILHELVELRRKKAEPGTEADLVPNSNKPHLVVNGTEIVRVQYKRAKDGETRTVWLRVGQPPLEALLHPSCGSR